MILVGGTGAINESVRTVLVSQGLTVERIGGSDRYNTSALVAARIKTREGASFSRRAFVARGDQFPDALAVAPLAYATKSPVLLVRPTSIPTSIAGFATTAGLTHATVVGQTGAVSSGVMTQMGSISGATMNRIGGADRYATAVAVGQYGVSQGWNRYTYVGVASGIDWPDALSGGVALGKMKGILLITRPNVLYSGCSALLSANKTAIYDVAVLGGSGALSEAVKTAVSAAIMP